ncbi:transposase [Paraburkholderia sp. A3BS-1L]|uniref:transposase n=1 Tax=Paraburkholderia sp. A3BS-1L TaxID=3028375 RepID=UPI003DA9BC10
MERSAELRGRQISARRYLFVIDGSRALGSAIGELFGERAHVQRCRTHKLHNVLEHASPKNASRKPH